MQAFDLGFPPGVTIDGVDTDALTNGEANAPSIFSSAGLSAGAFLQSPYPPSHPSGENFSAPDIQVWMATYSRPPGADVSIADHVEKAVAGAGWWAHYDALC